MPNVARLWCWAGVAGAAVVAACFGGTEPKPPAPTLNAITGIRVRARAAMTDTVLVSFSYLTDNCFVSSGFEARETGDGLRITATSSYHDEPCADPLRTDTVHVGYIVPPYHNAPLRLIFAEPVGGDSVRVVAQ